MQQYSYGRLSRATSGSDRSSLGDDFRDDEDQATASGFSADGAEVDGFIGYRNSTWKLVAYCVGVVLTGGALGLFTLWWPGMWPALTKRRASMSDATSFLVQAQGRYKMAYVHTEWDDVRWFEIQQLRFVYQPESATYVRLQHYKDLKCADIPQLAVGVQRDVALHRLRMSGPNAFNIPQDHVVIAWLRGMLSPFHVFILGTCILWYVDDYTLSCNGNLWAYQVFASVILAITILSVSLTVWDERRNINRIQRLINQQSVVETLRDGSWLAVQSGGLVHGDLITLDDNQIVPADVIIVSGECVVDESQLTGESTPVRKYAITEKEEEDDAAPSVYSQTHDMKHTLYSGTRLLKVIPRHGTDRVTAFVYSTGFNTRKGGLIRRILYPSDVMFRYRQHTMMFLVALLLVAPASFTISFIFWDSYDVGTWENILRSLEVITLLVPVTIPIMQMMAQGIAALNLRQYDIFTIAPSRIIMSGKIRMMCFDKTGTLTENGLRMKAVLPTEHSLDQASSKGKQADDSARAATDRVQFVTTPVKTTALPAIHLIKQAMACCHSATNIQGEGLIGHPLDVEMFNASQWHMRESKEGSVFSSTSSSSSSSSDASIGGGGALELRVIKAFPFVHSLRRMSVIVKSSLDDSISLFTKGSPETIRDLSLPETVPADLDDTLRENARQGNYILAIGAKLHVLDDEEEVHHVHRKQIDKDLVFLGLLIFQNEVREDSAEVISRLKRGDIRSIIITGDGPYTALAVARECGMIDLSSTVALGHTGQDGTTAGGSTQDAAPLYGIQWLDVDTGRDIGQDWVTAHAAAKHVALDDGFQRRRSTPSLFDRVRWWTAHRRQRDRHASFTNADHRLDSALLDTHVIDMESLSGSDDHAGSAARPSEFILTGTAFDYLKASEPHTLAKILFDVRIFARFSPEQKAEVVNLINGTGLVTGMCGDGGNDCGALRAAHAGIAVGGGGVEASVVSPFTYSHASIRCTEILIREGRGALANSLAAFKLLVLIYVVILHTVILLLYYHGSDMSDGMYIFQDLLLVFPLSLFILYPNSANQLAGQRPSASLFNSTVIASMLGQSGIVIGFIMAARQLLYDQDWYTPFDPVASGASARSDYWKSYETTTLWLFCNFQYIAAGIAFAIGRPFRKEIWHNYLLSLNVMGSLAAASWVLLLPPAWLREVLYLEDLESDFKVKLYFMALGCMIVQVLYEAFVTMGPFAWVMRRVSRWLNIKKKHRLRT